MDDNIHHHLRRVVTCWRIVYFQVIHHAASRSTLDCVIKWDPKLSCVLELAGDCHHRHRSTNLTADEITLKPANSLDFG